MQMSFYNPADDAADALPFQITHAWLRCHAVDGDSWNAAQLAAIGVAWPPARGWIDRVAGVSISDLQRRAFESGRTKQAARCTLIPAPYSGPALACIV